MHDFRVGERISTKGERCTVRYIGQVQGKTGTWLGVEWDDPARGKHSGTFEGVQYFSCRSTHPTAGSFLRWTVPRDEPRSFLNALRSKYAPDQPLQHISDATGLAQSVPAQSIWISGKEIEEIGYDKISQQQAQLQNLRTIILDQSLVSSRTDDETRATNSGVRIACPKVQDLDLSHNLFENLDEIAEICKDLPRLTTLTLDGNRLTGPFAPPASSHSSLFGNITTLSLNGMLLDKRELEAICKPFSHLRSLSISGNILTLPGGCVLPSSLTSLIMEDNDFSDLEAVAPLVTHCARLQELVVKSNRIAKLARNITSSTMESASLFPVSLTSVDLASNAISSWSVIDRLTIACPGLTQLRLSGNPVYDESRSAAGSVMTRTEVSMLIIARLPQIKILNYFTVTDKDRLNAESFYLSQITQQLTTASVEQENTIIDSHPRFNYLCNEYGKPTIARTHNSQVDAASLAARLLRCQISDQRITAGTTTHAPLQVEIPKSFSVYSLCGIVNKKLGARPMSTRLIWETGEKVPKEQPVMGREMVVEWDSEDELDEAGSVQWVEREVELIPSTRPLGTIIDGCEAVLRTEDSVKPRPQ